jgi:hypothetical protein
MNDKINQIVNMATVHRAASFVYPKRGRAPVGFTAGMALVYGLVYLKHQAGDPAALFMARANTHKSGTDALSYYAGRFEQYKLDNSFDSVATLRHLFVLVTGLGMAESSGKSFCGRDRSARNISADEAEAGAFQTSWNAHIANPLLRAMFDGYIRNRTAGFLDVFRVGAGSADELDLQNYGSGDGAAFQKRSKECPAFAAEFAAVTLRCLRGHYGTINRYIVAINPGLDDLFQKVEALIETDKAGFMEALSA